MVSFDISADRLRAVLEPDARPAPGSTAAVAVVCRAGDDGTELLFIQRASKDTDPWSGHMAFPGGRTEPADGGPHDTAARETLEEVGLDIRSLPRLGALHDLVPNRHLRTVHAPTYWLDGERPVLRANYEVAEILWVPLSLLADPSRHIDYEYPIGSGGRTVFPGIQLDKPTQVVWGLTLRMLADLYARLELPFIDLGDYA